MTLKRIGTLAAVLLTSGACSHVSMGPTAYSALPSAAPAAPQPVAVQSTGSAARPAEGVVGLAAPVSASAVLASPVSDPPVLAPVVIPGMPKLQEADTGRGGSNPSAVLDASTRTRMAWKALHPENLTERSILASRAARMAGADTVTMSAVSNARGGAVDRSLTSAGSPATYDREAAMSALLKGGQDAARPICSGC
ncbi:MAG: hypothetical protein INR70_21365 [Parafilimonas terrae]|jgi:hypothetical protein|nr:hypothetical protein [Parafilimonas terrae]